MAAPFPEATWTIALAAVVLVFMVGWLSVRAVRMTPSSPDRLVAELRLAQLAALVLAYTAAGYVGLAAAHPIARGSALDVALSLGFLVVAITAPLRDPREALTILALAFAGHTALDLLHRPDLLLADDIGPSWYVVGCAIANCACGALCYLPLLRR